MLSYHSTRFSNHSHSNSGVIMILVYQMIKVSYDCMGGSLTLSNRLRGYRHFGIRETFLVVEG